MSSSNPEWRVVEQVVALLEQILSPTAKVEHNVMLPVLGFPDREPRQCDVVITTGTQLRPTKTIVEVQKRKSKPEISQFHGWVAKMREVGAQHLVCVSAAGYPRSIIQEAQRLGPTVRLLTLQQLEEHNVPEFLNGVVPLPEALSVMPYISYDYAGPPSLDIPESMADETLSISPAAKTFGLGSSAERLSLSQLIGVIARSKVYSLVMQGDQTRVDFQDVIDFTTDRHNLWFYKNDVPIRIKHLPIRITASVNITQAPITGFTYRQESIDGVLAWVAVTTDVIDGEEATARIVFTLDDEGFFQIAGIASEGLEAFGIQYIANKPAADSVPS